MYAAILAAIVHPIHDVTRTFARRFSAVCWTRSDVEKSRIRGSSPRNARCRDEPVCWCDEPWSVAAPDAGLRNARRCSAGRTVRM